MTKAKISPLNVQSTEMAKEQLVFWAEDGKIFPNLLFEYFANIGTGNYFPDNKNKKNLEPIIVKINDKIVGHESRLKFIDTKKSNSNGKEFNHGK